MNERILIVEEEEKLAGMLHECLEQEGYEISLARRGDEVQARLRERPADLVLLGVMAPGETGVELCKSLRAASPGVSIIMVAARVDESADDYLCKPFGPREVLARVKAVLRRRRRGAPAHPGLELDDAGYKAIVHGRDLGLTALEYQLLKVLASHPGCIYTRGQLIDAVYSEQRVVSERSVDGHVKKIRRKIARALPEREIIHSLYGVGYKYEW